MSKQLANMLDAVLPELPAVGMFRDTLIELSQKPLAPEKRGKDHLYGDSIDSVESKGGGPASTLVAAIRMVQEFEAMRQDKNIDCKGLDERFESYIYKVHTPSRINRVTRIGKRKGGDLVRGGA